MEVINKRLPCTRAPLLKWMAFLALVPLLSLLPPQTPEQVRYNAWKQSGNLQAYMDYLSDTLDAAPAWTIEKADSLTSLIWRPPHNTEERVAHYFLLAGIGYAALQTGQVPVSIKWYEHALQLYRDEKDTAVKRQMEFEEYVCKPLGNNYTRVGDFTKAIQVQQEAIQSALNNRNLQPLPGLYSNIASTFFWMQEYDSAHQYIDKGLAVCTVMEPARLLLQNLKTECFIEQGFPDSAEAWNRQALITAAQLTVTNKSWIANAYTDRATLLKGAAQYTKAAGWLLKAQNLQEHASSRDKARLANQLGLLYIQSGLPGKALSWFDTSLQLLHIQTYSLYPDFTVTEALFGKAAALQAAGSIQAATWYVQAVLNDYYTQQLISSSLNSRSSLYHNEKQTEQAIALHHALFEKTSNSDYLLKALWLAELSKGRKLLYEQQRTAHWRADSLADTNKALFDNLKTNYLLLAQAATDSEKTNIQKRIDALEYTLNLKEDRFSKQLQAPSFDSFVAWLKNASQEKTIISYFAGEQNMYCITIQRNQYRHDIIKDSAYKNVLKTTGSFIEDYFYRDHDAYNNNPGSYATAAAGLLHAWLPHWGQYQNDMIISPDGILHQLPFEALVEDSTEHQFLGSTKAITYQYSLLSNLNSATEAVHPAAISRFSFEKSHLGFPALPYAATERSFLDDHFNTVGHKADTASMATFIKALNAGDILQLSTHAVAPQDGSQPYLVLKDKIYLGQLQYLTTRCPLMVLAACETGTGTLQKGEGLQSLGRSFIGKGVQGVLSSRWEMDDATTAQLIQAFYKNVKPGKYPSKAMLAARQQYLRNAVNTAAKNPWLWAGLYYQGNDRAIILPPPPAHNILLWTIAIISGILIACLLNIKKLRLLKFP